ncbi:MAG: prepilin-type N-terminal cleavage/methylation domain-containing protein [Bacilli bacterium]
MKKNGFTLIELLASIILMGIIIGIAVPTYNKYVEKSRKNTFEQTLIGLTRSIELYIVERPGEDFTTPLDILTYIKEAENVNTIKTGKFYLSNGKVILLNVNDGTFCGNGYKKNLSITKGSCPVAE